MNAGKSVLLSWAIAANLVWLTSGENVLAQLQTTSRLTGTYSTQGPIVVKSSRTPVTLRGLEFQAEFGKLVGGTDPAPFASVTNNDGSRWAVSSETDVILDGEIRLDVTMIPPLPGYGVTMSGQMTDDTETFSFFMQNRSRLEAEVAHPYDGGPVQIRSSSSFRSIEIEATAAEMVGGSNPAPFQTVVNSPTSWKTESDSLVEFNWNRWDRIAEPTEFDLQLVPTAQATATLTDGLDSITVDVIRDEPLPGNLIGGYSMFGGPVFLKTTSGTESINQISI